MATTYKTILMYRDSHGRRVLATRLTLEEAQAICNDAESSSETCTKPYLKRRTRERGPWFVGYERE